MLDNGKFDDILSWTVALALSKNKSLLLNV